MYIYYRRNENGLLEAKEFATDSTLALLRISDPVLTQLVKGYTNAEFIGDRCLTPVPMPKQTGRFPAFGQEAFVIAGTLERIPGATISRLNMQTGYVTATISQYAEGVAVPQEDLNEWAGSADMLINGKVGTVTSRIMLKREYLQAVACTTTTNYASGHYISGAAFAWASTGDPIQKAWDAQELILKKNGRMGNVAFFSWGAWTLFINNASVLKRIKYGGTPIAPAQVTPQAVAQLLHVDEVLIGGAVYGTGSAPGSDGGVGKSSLTKSFVWDSVQSNNFGILIRGKGSGIEPAFGYTWVRQNSPVVESYYENQSKSMIYDQQHFFTPAVTANEAGVLYYSIA
jgi:hypothetical protein